MTSPNSLPVAGIRLLDTAAVQQIDFGPLAGLEGTWTGSRGWNVIAVPGPQDFILEVIPYEETITFSPAVIAGNRGPFTDGQESVQNVVGFLYQQVITSLCETDFCGLRGFSKGTEIHAETGLFLYLPDSEYGDGFNIARLSTIPHGNSLLALGASTETATPQDFIPDNNIRPFPVPLGYGETQYFKQQFPEFDQTNPNSALQQALSGVPVDSVTTLDFSTKNGTGGILNIPFIQKNINTTLLDATFWLETLKDGSLQLQYSQNISLVFPATGTTNPITWPHVTVNTLQKAATR